MKIILQQAYGFLHRHLLWCLVTVYVLGAAWPQFGLWIRGMSANPAADGHGSGWMLKILLGILLFNAGLGVDTRQIKQIPKCWSVLITAFFLSVAMPLAVVFAVSCLPLCGLEATNFYSLMIGLAIIAAMPVAGSSTAWAQNADGNLAFSICLVLLSTFLSPITAWFVFQATEAFWSAGTTSSMIPLSTGFVVNFLALWVILPIVAGMIVRWIAGAVHIGKIKSILKSINLINLLVLNYANASLSLPGVFQNPNLTCLSIVISITMLLCIINFGTAEVVSRLYKVKDDQRVSLFFALGMTNNGAGLVLIASASAPTGDIMLPIILYNLLQHLGAGFVDRFVLQVHEQQNGDAFSNNGLPRMAQYCEQTCNTAPQIEAAE
jgi:bile acid:Na+ symporter, BASS family